MFVSVLYVHITSRVPINNCLVNLWGNYDIINFDDEIVVKTVSKCFAHTKGPNIQTGCRKIWTIEMWWFSQFAFFGKLIHWGNFPIHVCTMVIHWWVANTCTRGTPSGCPTPIYADADAAVATKQHEQVRYDDVMSWSDEAKSRPVDRSHLVTSSSSAKDE